MVHLKNGSCILCNNTENEISLNEIVFKSANV